MASNRKLRSELNLSGKYNDLDDDDHLQHILHKFFLFYEFPSEPEPINL